MNARKMFRALAEGLPMEHLSGPEDAEVTGVSCDSRTVEPGHCFVAVEGHAVDGHEYVGDAIERGAAVVVIRSGRSSVLPELSRVACFATEDPRHATGILARSYRGHPDLHLELVAVTGTNGKTTVSHLVQWILQGTGRGCGLLGTIEYDTGKKKQKAPLTTPDPCEFYRLLDEMRRAGLGACAFEASSHALDQERIGPAEIDVAAFTNLSREHLDYHPDLQSYLGAKRRLLERLEGPLRRKDRGHAVVFVDDPTLAGAPWPDGTVRVGAAPKAEIRLLEAETGREGSRLRVSVLGEQVDFSTRLLGSFNMENALMAIACAAVLGVDPPVIRDRLASAPPVCGRMEPVELDGGPLVLVDYAHTPDGLEKAVTSCRGLCEGRIHVVFGCGGDRDRGKRPLMAEAVCRSADEIYLTLDNPRTEDPQQIFRDAEAGMREAIAQGRARRIEDRFEAIAAALAGAGPDDLVLIAGKGHENHQILGTTKHPWDDRAAARDAWARMEEKA